MYTSLCVVDAFQKSTMLSGVEFLIDLHVLIGGMRSVDVMIVIITSIHIADGIMMINIQYIDAKTIHTVSEKHSTGRK